MEELEFELGVEVGQQKRPENAAGKAKTRSRQQKRHKNAAGQPAAGQHRLVFRQPSGRGDCAGGAHEAAEVAADALGSRHLRAAGIWIHAQGLMASIGT